MQITRTIQVDLFAEGLRPEVRVNRGDNAVQIKVRLLNGGQTVTPTGTARVYVKKTDGTLVYNDCEIDGDYVVVQTTTQMTAAAGRSLIELEMTQGETVLSTPIFWLCVGDSIADDSAIESSNEFTALEQALQDVEELKKTGLKGDTGNGIDSDAVTVEYQASTGGTVIPTGAWSTTIPEVAAGSYLWTRITIPYTDGSSTISYSVSKMGDTGPQGDVGPQGPPGKVSVDTDAVVTYDTPDTYTAPASGNTLDTWLGRVTRGLSNLFLSVSNLTSGLAQKLNASQVLSEAEWNTGTVSQRGYLADAKDILDEFAQLNTDIGNRIRCIRDTPLLTDVPAGYSEQSVSLSNISGTVVGTAVRVTSYASGGGYLCVTLNSSNAWIEAEKAQKSIKLEILRFYTN